LNPNKFLKVTHISSRGSDAKKASETSRSGSLICPQKSPSPNNLYEVKPTCYQQKIH